MPDASQYYILNQIYSSENCGILYPQQGMENRYKLSKGVPVDKVDDEPSWTSLIFKMADEFPGIKVGDVIYNALGFLMVSAKFKRLIEKNSTSRTDFFSFQLENHKGRAVGTFFIANVINIQDCVDTDKTEAIDKSGRPGEYLKVMRLFLKDQRIPENHNIFRIKNRPRIIIVRQDLKTIIEKEDISGVVFHKLGEEINL